MTPAPMSAPIRRGAPTPGIYLIFMPADPQRRVYVGQSGRGVETRMNEHRVALRSKKHHCAHLQHAYNKYGEDAFVWALAQAVPDDAQALTQAEQAWMDSVGEARLFNLAPAAGSVRGLAMSEAAKAAKSAARARYIQTVAPEVLTEIAHKGHASRDPAQRRATNAKIRAAQVAHWASLTPEQRAAKVAAQSPGASARAAEKQWRSELPEKVRHLARHHKIRDHRIAYFAGLTGDAKVARSAAISAGLRARSAKPADDPGVP